MKVYSYFIFSLCLFTSIYAQTLIFEQSTLQEPLVNESFFNSPLILECNDEEINDAEDQISPQALSEEDITLLIFDETELQNPDIQENSADEFISKEPLNQNNCAQEQHNPLPSAQLQTKNIIKPANPEEEFLTLLQDFISSNNILCNQTLSSIKKAKLQGKLIAKQIQEIAAICNISIALAQNITRNHMQKECQDLHLGINKLEKKSLKQLLKSI